MSSVASATSAAPTYFTPFERRGHTFLDGGIWANNPTMAALVEALSCFTTQPEEVRILSIGCGQKPFQVTEGQVKNSGMAHWKNIIDVAMYFQSVTAVNQAGLLIGRDRITRAGPARRKPTHRPGRLEGRHRTPACGSAADRPPQRRPRDGDLPG